MFTALVLVFGCLLQRKPVTTEGHHGTNRHIFYAVQMDRGVRGARVLARQHGLEFIQRVSAFFSPCGLSLSFIQTNLPGDLFINAAEVCSFFML